MNLFFPYEWLATFIVNLTGLQGHAAEALQFFLYDTLKIFTLLIVIIYAVSILRSYFPPERARKLLANRKAFLGNILAALLGVVTPFCTCSAIPLFLGFLEAGIPLGVTFSFLIASPMVNEVAFVLLFGLFGWKVAVLYLASGLVIAIVSGIIISSLHLEHLVKKLGKKNIKLAKQGKVTMQDRTNYARRYTWNIFKQVWLFVLLGVGLGALIHGYVPADFLARYAGKDVWYAVPLAVIVGVPLYANAAGVIPLISALTEKGVALGTTLAFTMAVTGLSLPEFLILKKVMKLKLLLLFFAIVAAGIIITGYLFNAIL